MWKHNPTLLGKTLLAYASLQASPLIPPHDQFSGCWTELITATETNPATFLHAAATFDISHRKNLFSTERAQRLHETLVPEPFIQVSHAARGNANRWWSLGLPHPASPHPSGVFPRLRHSIVHLLVQKLLFFLHSGWEAFRHETVVHAEVCISENYVGKDSYTMKVTRWI